MYPDRTDKVPNCGFQPTDGAPPSRASSSTRALRAASGWSRRWADRASAEC